MHKKTFGVSNTNVAEGVLLRFQIHRLAASTIPMPSAQADGVLPVASRLISIAIRPLPIQSTRSSAQSRCFEILPPEALSPGLCHTISVTDPSACNSSLISQLR